MDRVGFEPTASPMPREHPTKLDDWTIDNNYRSPARLSDPILSHLRMLNNVCFKFLFSFDFFYLG